MKLSTLARTLRADLARHWDADATLATNLWELALTQGVWATATYRVGQWVHASARSPATAPARLALRLASKGVEIATGISLPARANIGPGFYVGHFGAIIVHPDTVMGSNCSIGQGVTIGTRGRGSDATPVLGDDVYVGAGAKVLGGIRVGDGAAIGANAVVVTDLEPGVVAVGIPARARAVERGGGGGRPRINRRRRT